MELRFSLPTATFRCPVGFLGPLGFRGSLRRNIRSPLGVRSLVGFFNTFSNPNPYSSGFWVNMFLDGEKQHVFLRLRFSRIFLSVSLSYKDKRPSSCMETVFSKLHNQETGFHKRRWIIFIPGGGFTILFIFTPNPVEMIQFDQYV